MNIPSLLNPYELDSYHHGYRSSESPAPSHLHRPVSRNTATPKRQKIPKDAAIFTPSKPSGFVNFPPYEAVEHSELWKQHDAFNVYPLGEIRTMGVRRIPYNSDKKDFLVKTGRDAFEVFHYQFIRPGCDKKYVVMWDYKIGLVRITPFFKCLQFSKTTPAKVLNLNPGLRNISYSITGGALAAQGYWMPYKAAKAVAATFCYEIRWALTPIFGEDFLSICIPPDDPNFSKFLISPSIVRECTEETKSWITEGVTYKPYRPDAYTLPTTSSSPPPQAPSSINAPRSPKVPSTAMTTPRMKFSSPPWGPKTTKMLYPKTADQESGYGSGYGTDEAASDKYVYSPEVSPRSHGWTSINGSPSSNSLPAFSPPQRVLTSVPEGYGDRSHHSKRTLSKVAYGDDGEDMHHRPTRPPAMYGFDKPITAYGLDKPVVRPAGNGGYYGRNEVDVRPPTRGTPVTAATSHNDADYREEYHVSGRHEYRTRYPHLSERDFEGAENLLLLSQPEERRHKDRRTKRTRRGSQY